MVKNTTFEHDYYSGNIDNFHNSTTITDVFKIELLTVVKEC
mgnify:CR=1 FL=1